MSALAIDFTQPFEDAFSKLLGFIPNLLGGLVILLIGYIVAKVLGKLVGKLRGKVGFDGTGPNGKIDPTLDFVAESTANSVTATLNIGGYASQPKITLSAVPTSKSVSCTPEKKHAKGLTRSSQRHRPGTASTG